MLLSERFDKWNALRRFLADVFIVIRYHDMGCERGRQVASVNAEFRKIEKDIVWIVDMIDTEDSPALGAVNMHWISVFP